VKYGSNKNASAEEGYILCIRQSVWRGCGKLIVWELFEINGVGLSCRVDKQRAVI
jgi:hypothetical protein